MLKKIKSTLLKAWDDEMSMLKFAIAIGTPIAVLVVLNFGLFFVVAARHTEAITGVAAAVLVCLARAAQLRFRKLQ